jgi:hypothetical protein
MTCAVEKLNVTHLRHCLRPRQVERARRHEGLLDDGVDPKTPTKSAKPSRALNATNLGSLGADRLVLILLEVSEGHPIIRRRLRLELAALTGSDALAAEIEKPLEAMKAARGRVTWRRLKGLVAELGLLRAMITGPLAQADPEAAVGLLLRFLTLERSVLARLKDTRGQVAEAFEGAMGDLTRIAESLPVRPPGLADAIITALDEVGPAAMGALTRGLVPALDAAEIAQLRASIETRMAPHQRVNAGWRAALQALLDAQGDAVAYAATYSPSEAVLPPIGARIARRLIKAGRLDEAANALERSDPSEANIGRGAEPSSVPDPGLVAWRSAQIDLLEARGELQAAQHARWRAFERDLSADQLRAYLRRLTGFDDVIATDRALAFAAKFKPFTLALAFLTSWPALPEAAYLVVSRAGEIDAAEVEVLEPAARALEGRYPLAATLLLRAMVIAAARSGRTNFFVSARRWLDEAASLATHMTDFDGHEDHADFEARVAHLLRR